MSPYESQIIRLLKSLLLNPADMAERASDQFFPGKQSGFRVPYGMVMNWWYSPDTFFARDDVAALAIQSSPDFKNCDHETVASVVMDAARERCMDGALFHTDQVAFRGRATLFECSKAHPKELANTLCDTIASNLREKIGRRCTLHAAPRFTVPSFQLETAGVRVIARNDEEAWQSLVDEGFEFDGWTPQRPVLKNRSDATFSPPIEFQMILVSDDIGTAAGSRFDAVLRFRKLTAVLHAIASRDLAYRIHKAAAVPWGFLVQFPHQTLGERSIGRNDTDPLLPYFASDIDVSVAQTAEIAKWYSDAACCEQQHQDRIDKAANFLNRGLNAKDVESFINYFVTLDALFGQRGSVESSILEGVRALDLGSDFDQKADWLFELRNELVHGGSRYIAEWPKHGRYTQHFRTKPADDVRQLAELAVLGAPQLFSK